MSTLLTCNKFQPLFDVVGLKRFSRLAGWSGGGDILLVQKNAI